MPRITKGQKSRALPHKAQQSLFEQMVHCAREEDTLGIVIRGHLYLESIVRAMLETELLFPIADETFARSLPLRVRSELCIGLGLMGGDWLKPIKAVIDLRNEFAHNPAYDVSNARIGGLVGSLPDLGKDIYKAIGHESSPHMRLINFFITMIIALNNHISMLKTGAKYVRGRARRSRPPNEMILRAMINVRNTTFQIPYLKPNGKKSGRAVTLQAS